MSEFDTKLRFLAKQVAWIIIFVLMLPFCLFGISTGVQYMNDDCVKTTTFALALDYWLIVACTYDIIFAIVVMLLLCCHVPGTKRKWIIWPMHAVNIIWMAIGIFIIIESNVRCQHNTLWVISVVDVAFKGSVVLMLFVIYLFNRIGLCNRLGSYISFEESPYEFQPMVIGRVNQVYGDYE